MLPKHDDKYGSILERVAVDDGEHTYQVAVIEHRGKRSLDIRSIYYSHDEPRYGKGIRIPLNIAEDTLLAAGALWEEHKE